MIWAQQDLNRLNVTMDTFRLTFNVIKFAMNRKTKVFVILSLSVIQFIYCDCGLMDASYYDTPDLISISYIDSNTETGSEAIFSCPRGYDLTGTSRTQCDGDWLIPVKPKCVEVECPGPKKVRNGYMLFQNYDSHNRYLFENSYTVRCKRGYKITGSHIRTCMENGSWSGKPVRCRRVDFNCDLSSRIENGIAQLITNPDIKSRYRKKTVYNIICDSGYRLKGPSIAECGDTDIPVCEPEVLRQHCPRLSHNISNGQLNILSETDDDAVYQIKCDDGYTAQDMPVLYCQEDGSWSSVSPFCQKLQQHNGVEMSILMLCVTAIIVVVCVLLIIRFVYSKCYSVTTKDRKDHLQKKHDRPVTYANGTIQSKQNIRNYINSYSKVEIDTDNDTFLRPVQDSGESSVEQLLEQPDNNK